MIRRKLYQIDSLFLAVSIIFSVAGAVLIHYNHKSYYAINAVLIAILILVYYSLNLKKSYIIFTLFIFIFFYIQTGILKNIKTIKTALAKSDILLPENAISGKIKDLKIIDSQTAKIYLNDLNINEYRFIGGSPFLTVTITGIPDFKKLLTAERISFASKINICKLKNKRDIFNLSLKQNFGWSEIEFEKIIVKKSKSTFAFNLRYYIYRLFYDTIKYPFNTLSYSVITGDSDAIDNYAKTSFQKSGIIHILAISGLHIGLISMFLIFALGIFFNRTFSNWITISLLWIYCGFIGFTPSVLRATIMISVYLTGKVIHKNIYQPNVLLTSFVIISLLNPADVFGIGFQLSFLSVSAIMVSNSLFPLKNNLISVVIMSFFIQLFTIPAVSCYFKIIPVFSILINLIVLPIFSAALPSIFLTALASCFSISLSEIFGFISAELLSVIVKISDSGFLFGIKNIIEYQFSIFYAVVYYIILSIILLTFYERKLKLKTKS
ncbi:MAG TPA: ComEC/Rec2 family competence protein [bacterium]|nr:ComEC/Rec2 family competence protein [bacterium]HPN30941.1 ComEC/Rec2 family competence protein [bacterium]